MKRKVLVVAGIAALRAAITRILQLAGYAVELTSGAPRTRELLAAGPFDAAIAAPSGLGTDGQELIRELQAVVGRVILLADDAPEASRSPDLLAGRGTESYDRSIDMLVARLRRKIEPDPKFPRFVVTVPGEG